MFGRLLEVEILNKCTPLWREAYLEVNMYKTPQVRRAFGSYDVEKVHAVVARSTSGSEHVKITTCSGHLWTSRCRPDVEKVDAVVVRSKCSSQKCETWLFLSLFLGVRCQCVDGQKDIEIDGAQ